MPTVQRRARASDYGDDDHNGLPRFRLPNEGSDPLDAARTVERPALRNLVRGRRRRPSDSIVEVAPEDILLEAFIEEEEPPASPFPSLPKAMPTMLPPATSKFSTERLPMSSGPSNSYFAHEMLSTPLPQGAPMLAQPHPVDQLLAMQQAQPMPNSIAPVAYTPNVPQPPSSFPTPVYDLAARTQQRKARERRSFWSLTIITLGILAGVLVALVLPKGTFAKMRGSRQAAPPPVTVLVPVPTPSPLAAPPPAPTVPSVAVDSLPSKPAIDPGMTYVTFPASAVGHRIYVDSSVIVSSPEKAMMKCGKHKIRLAEGKARKVDLPCGGEYTLE